LDRVTTAGTPAAAAAPAATGAQAVYEAAPLAGELISKKELLAQTGISYGQLYRWKRDGLLPEEWFIKRSSFTGQETYLPREQALSRVKTILELKDSRSLEQLAQLFTPSQEARYSLDFLQGLPGVNRALLQGLAARLGKPEGGQPGLNFGQAVLVLALGGQAELDAATAQTLALAALPAAGLWAGESMGCALIAVALEATAQAAVSYHIVYYQATTPPLTDSGARLVAMLDLPWAAELIRINSTQLAN